MASVFPLRLGERGTALTPGPSPIGRGGILSTNAGVDLRMGPHPHSFGRLRTGSALPPSWEEGITPILTFPRRGGRDFEIVSK